MKMKHRSCKALNGKMRTPRKQRGQNQPSDAELLQCPEDHEWLRQHTALERGNKAGDLPKVGKAGEDTSQS